MPVYFAFLRAINVGGNNKIPMAELREMLVAMGFSNVRTLLQSGNAIFESPKQTASALEAKLEAGTEKRFGLKITYMVRTKENLEGVIGANPFPKVAVDDPSHLLVLFMKSKPRDGAEAALQAAIKGSEVAKIRGSEAYITYPDGIGTSKLNNTVIERHLGTAGTARNWNTILKSLALVS
jgi:uncharacterized protein (DUF1697 family)